MPSDVSKLLAQILCCPDCAAAVTPALRCPRCGRSFGPAEDGIVDALSRELRPAPADKEALRTVIERSGERDRQEGVVRYEQAFHDEQASYYDCLFASPLPLRTYYDRLVRRQVYGFVRRAPFVVDLCCGTGKSSQPLIDCGVTVVGIDVSREMLKVYRRKRPSLRNPVLIQADASRPPLQPNSCAAIVMIGGLHHIPDRAGSLRACHDAIREGGLLILHEPLKTGRTHRLSHMLENLYAAADPVRVGRALARRVGLRGEARPAGEPPADFTPYERPFTSLAELRRELPDGLQVIAMASQANLSFKEFPSWLQSRLVAFPGWLVVRLDESIRQTRSDNASGDAVFAVLSKVGSQKVAARDPISLPM
jgi:SAM-dependent methyltransferase